MGVPGIGSFPCRFKKAEYATMNFCACSHREGISANFPIHCLSCNLNCHPVNFAAILVVLISPPLAALRSRFWMDLEEAYVNIANADTPRHDCVV